MPDSTFYTIAIKEILEGVPPEKSKLNLKNEDNMRIYDSLKKDIENAVSDGLIIAMPNDDLPPL